MPESIKRILMATDFSDCSQDALDHAVSLAKTYNADLYLIHVFDTLAFSRVPQYDSLLKKIREVTSEDLMRLAADLRKEGIEVHPVYREGVAHDQIVKEAQEISADLIAMGTHGRSGEPYEMIGSVAERVVRKATCPVLTVRPKSLR